MVVFSCELCYHCFDFFCLTRIWGKPFVFTQVTTNLVISLDITQKMLLKYLNPLLHPSISKEQESHTVLATSICLSLIFAVAFSFINCCLLPLYHEDIFEKRNVHVCLQCPPHWNTWGKVSSLTLWSIPAPHLEPQRLVPLPMRIFFSWWLAIFLASSRRIS